ncbi:MULTISPECIES: DUF421 domain-containing protein [Bacillus]|uniref:DUF421 domain-containing protein n=1 Tax=Bacillus TaxID=1386 RepID=UPI002243B00E|nr:MULTISPECIES: DUF421 domain-containing protein [Bacillus]MDN5386530.1 DUF421 domain-containing protein [Bacillus sp. LB7]MEC1022702.1 DUF421 domain-containing protein [Bacillus paralicheniformis]MEC1028273.1 DUF421 domain-containing protein [Bacillus paralicheniformis]MEC1033764.1 DUF421 domain-containing protein [Bacillus paralicheniformis]MEC1049519.1 DUF421 domain-containing protein [Bacillus paralicheniformis]
MDEILALTFRTIVLYFIIFILFRLMGKREIGELSILDLVVFIMMAEIAVLAIENLNDHLLHTIIPILVLTLIQVIFAYLSLKNQKIRRLLDGKPTIIIDRGKIDEHAMRTQRYNYDDLMTQLRDKNVERIADVSYAILEPTGKLSVFTKDGPNKMIELPLIVDGIVQKEQLEKIGKDREWLEQKLEKRGHRDISQISYCTYNNGSFFIDKKDEFKP